jgi:methylmalonyl-CoA mutase
MGDVQEYFITKNVRNFIRFLFQDIILPKLEQPITQLAFTLSNGFTYVEYYLSRGMNINDFGPNLSFFFRMVLIQNMQLLVV